MKAEYLINFIPNITALNSKHFTLYKLNNRPPSTGQTIDYTILNYQSKHFSSLKKMFQYRHLANRWKGATLKMAIVQLLKVRDVQKCP